MNWLSARARGEDILRLSDDEDSIIVGSPNPPKSALED
jgi:hypothetical protein